jgi:hypothetical protein
MPGGWKKPWPEDQGAGREAATQEVYPDCTIATIDALASIPPGRQWGNATAKGKEPICRQILIHKARIG